MKDMDMSFNFKEIDQFQKALDRVGKLPQKVVSKAASAGADVSGNAVKAAAPIGKTGRLSKGFKKYSERSRTRGKKVYGYGMSDSKSKTKQFQKDIPANPDHPGKRRTNWKHAYYPSSVEYGFLTRSTGNGLKYVQGQHFVRKASEAARPQVESTIIKTAIAELEKEWQKK